MASVTLKVHYDGKYIVLDEPFEVPVSAPLSVIVLAPVSENDFVRERASWATLSAQKLERAFGDDDPEYTAAHLRP